MILYFDVNKSVDEEASLENKPSVNWLNNYKLPVAVMFLPSVSPVLKLITRPSE